MGGVRAALAASLAVVAAFGVSTAEASTIQVQDGTLTVSQAAGEQTSLVLGRDHTYAAGTWWTHNPARGLTLPPGTQPTPGPGCVSGSHYGWPGVQCTDVARIEIAFGNGSGNMDLIAKDAAIPITIAGGPGHDDLTVATPPGDVTVDGGAGDDTITVQSATALGGPGDDTISLSLDANPLLTASPTINCGPGSDRLAIFATLQPTVRPIVDAATCPPYLRSVGRFARWPFIAPPTFRVPPNRKIQFALFRVAEPASGELRFGGCAKPTSFHAAAGEQVRVKLTIAVRVARTIARYRGRDFICPITVTGTDAQGERIDQGLLSFSLAR